MIAKNILQCHVLQGGRQERIVNLCLCVTHRVIGNVLYIYTPDLKPICMHKIFLKVSANKTNVQVTVFRFSFDRC